MIRLAAIALPIAPALASAAETVPPSGTLTTLLQVLLGLGVVMAAIAGAAWLARRYLPGGGMGSGPVRVVGGVMVGPKERVVVVEVNDTWLVLGVTATQVNELHTLPRPAHASTSTPSSVFPPPGSALARWLRAGSGRES
ncbi:MAG: flagellar biosynthetic protein FliO [Betaproteobacteria bacterium]|nr:flagellar biosynthetic protein FliO [Betaproteobacteria bacterium]MBL8535631.1 flagellar biosynthetic protein FliO [Betaproteobacteria bacterium]